MALDIVTTVVTPAGSYDLTTLSAVKLDLAIKAGFTLTTVADTPSGQVLPFLATSGIALKQSVGGINIAPGTIVSALTSNSVTISAAIDGDVPAGSAIVFGADTTLDSYFSRQISLASSAIQNFCNRKFAIETIQDVFNFLENYNERQNNNRLRVLQLTKEPLVAVSSVTVMEDGAPVTLTEGVDFFVDTARAQLIRLYPSQTVPAEWKPYQTTVIYTAGFSTIPSDLDDSCSRMVKKAFWARGRDPAIMEENQNGLGLVKYWVSNTPDGNIPPEIADILEAYREIVVA